MFETQFKRADRAGDVTVRAAECQRMSETLFTVKTLKKTQRGKLNVCFFLYFTSATRNKRGDIIAYP